jgi:hypothetical protein
MTDPLLDDLRVIWNYEENLDTARALVLMEPERATEILISEAHRLEEPEASIRGSFSAVLDFYSVVEIEHIAGVASEPVAAGMRSDALELLTPFLTRIREGRGFATVLPECFYYRLHNAEDKLFPLDEVPEQERLDLFQRFIAISNQLECDVEILAFFHALRSPRLDPDTSRAIGALTGALPPDHWPSVGPRSAAFLSGVVKFIAASRDFARLLEEGKRAVKLRDAMWSYHWRTYLLGESGDLGNRLSSVSSRIFALSTSASDGRPGSDDPATSSPLEDIGDVVDLFSKEGYELGESVREAASKAADKRPAPASEAGA